MSIIYTGAKSNLMLTYAKILAHSKDKFDQELVTFELFYPRKVHAEVMAHRGFSRNTASSRAIPFARNLDEISNNLYTPEDIRKNQPGMQGHSKVSKTELVNYHYYHTALWDATRTITTDLNITVDPHKQHINRYLEPFQYVRVILTTSLPSLNNFFTQRIHEAADPEIFLLATKMKAAKDSSSPVFLIKGAWHLPFITQDERYNYNNTLYNILKVSVARCARVSYNNFETGNRNFVKDLALYEKLRNAIPPHFSPFEHPAVCADVQTDDYYDISGNYYVKNKFYNFDGFKSLRFLIEKDSFHV